MMSSLGACLEPQNLQLFFLHSLDPSKKVYILLAVCHMLKLARNTLGKGGIMLDINNDKIYWQYVIELQKLQEKEGLRLGNKLKAAHIQKRQQKTKVNLAAQALSSSVAEAIQY